MGRLGTVTATAMVPGVSSNRRLYTREAIAKAASRMDGQIKAGGLPILMRSHHGAGDDSTRIVGAWRGVTVDPTSGAMKVHGDLADTSAGRDIAALTTPDDQGRRFLDSVSIYGYWVGDPQTIDHMGQQVETADDLEIAAVDFTGTPGVAGARIESVRIGESRAIPLIAESKELSVTADQTSPEGATEAKGANTDAPAGSFADPGYQSDGKKRYPLDTKAHIRAAWAFINQTANAKPYTAAQVKRIKARIKTAAKKAGITTSSESAAADYQTLTETLLPRIAEAYASMSIDNGQGDIRVAGYVSDPTDLPDLAAATSRATLAALAALDPDEDGDIDLGPDDSEDTSGEDDNDMDGTCPFCGSDVPAGASFCPGCGQPITSGESAGDTKENDVSDTQETKASDTATSETTTAGTEATSPATETTATDTTTTEETAAGGLDVAALGKAIGEAVAAAITTPATTEVSTTSETTSDTDTKALSEATTSTPAFAEALKAMKDELREEIVAAVGPRRRGLVRTAETEASKPLHEMTDEEFRAHRTELLNQVVPGGPQS